MPTIGVKKPSTVRAERHFARWWGEYFRGQRLSSVTPAALDDARQKLLSQGLTQARVNRYVAWMRHVLNLAVRDGKLQSNPVTKLKMYREAKGRTRYLTPDEEQKLYDALPPPYRPWVRLAILTGMRQAEQFSFPEVSADSGESPSIPRSMARTDSPRSWSCGCSPVRIQRPIWTPGIFIGGSGRQLCGAPESNGRPGMICGIRLPRAWP